jgi:hypothetical protein
MVYNVKNRFKAPSSLNKVQIPVNDLVNLLAYIIFGSLIFLLLLCKKLGSVFRGHNYTYGII